jgi:hypothetical protein
VRTASRLGVYALGVVGAFGLAASAGAILGPIDVGATASHSSLSTINIPKPATSVEMDGYTVSLSGDLVVGESALTFDVSFAGKPIATEPYLGAAGDLVIISTGDLGYLRTQSIDEADKSVHFVADFPTSGTYRLFFDFAHAGKVHTAAFTVEIAAMAGMFDDQEGG